MRNVGIISNKKKDPSYLLTHQVIDFLRDLECICYIEPSVHDMTQHANYTLNDITIKHCDFLLVIGGDGTLLSAISSYGKYKKPFLGINMGRIGFLADISQQEYKDKLTQVINGDFLIENRMMVELLCGKHKIGNALNEVLFRHEQGSGVGEFKIYVDDVILTHYAGDGVLIAAPTGSTAYSLSAGGPIVNPSCEIMIIQPISPHSLNNRSVIISTKEKVTVEFNSENTIVCLDGMKIDTKENNRLTISKSSQSVDFIRVKDYNFYKLLFDKLKQSTHTRGGLA